MKKTGLAFYAPLKAPNHPVASGDRTIARLLVRALQSAGYQVDLPSELRSFEGKGDHTAQSTIRRAGHAEAQKLIGHYRALPTFKRPALWFTYHLYHKAPDWVGPAVSKALGIPYVLAEASYARKQQHGPWADGLTSTGEAIRQANAVFTLNPRDRGALTELRGVQGGVHALTPFLDKTVFQGPRHDQRETLARQHGVDAAVPWLISVGMARPGDKLASFALQAQVLSAMTDQDWHWWVIGDGAASAELDALLTPLGDRVTRLGAMAETDVAVWLRNADLAVWPAINEAIGMALLEAQAAGLPVVAGHTDGVAAICHPEACAVVPQEQAALTNALSDMLRESALLPEKGRLAQQAVSGIADAGRALHQVLQPLHG